MKAGVLAIRAMNRNTPRFIIQIQLRILMKATARAFGCVPANIRGLSCEEALRKYALFTKEQADLALQSGQDMETLPLRLYTEAYRLGLRLRRVLRLFTDNDIQTLIILLYRNIGITMKGSIPGEIYIKSCYFSDFYPAETCKLISSLDNGIMSGLHQGGALTFNKRITEGNQCCMASFQKNGGTE